MANRVDGNGSSNLWSCCCFENDEKESGETDKLTDTHGEQLLKGGPPEQVRMGRDTEAGATSKKRSHSPGPTYNQYQTAVGTPDSPMK